MQSARTHETRPPSVLGGIFSPMYMDTAFFFKSQKVEHVVFTKAVQVVPDTVVPIYGAEVRVIMAS
jgi:PHP family Zn ribbon phosphoesterase